MIHVIGCGSLGSLVAAQLASSGIGKFLLIDHDIMKWENVGRHHLGAQHVGANKARSLSEVLRRDYPHIDTVDTWPNSWETFDEEKVPLQACDLIISAMGSWGAECLLNEWHIANNRNIPIIYAWLEPYALAAHAVAILKNGGCFACQLSPHGRAEFKVTSWKNNTTKQQPACGSFFQPYGSIELTEASTLVSKMALDALLEDLETSIAHTWIGRVKDIQNRGGSLNPQWRHEIDSHPSGEFTHVWRYDCNDTCVWCGKT